MKILIYTTLVLFLLSTNSIIAQTTERSKTSLLKEIDSLKLELERCQSSVQYKVQYQNIFVKKNGKLTLNQEDFRKNILQEIKAKSKPNFQKAKEVIHATNQFIGLLSTVKNELIERTGGFDPVKKRPFGYRDKEILNTVIVREAKGTLIKKEIQNLRSIYLPSAEKSSALLKALITLDDKSWKPGSLKNTPMIVIFPILAKYIEDAKHSERMVLEYLKNSK